MGLAGLLEAVCSSYNSNKTIMQEGTRVLLFSFGSGVMAAMLGLVCTACTGPSPSSKYSLPLLSEKVMDVCAWDYVKRNGAYLNVVVMILLSLIQLTDH
jgi:hypothetical protein